MNGLSLYFMIGVFLLVATRNSAANRGVMVFAGWKIVYQGTTIGHKKMDIFPRVTARPVRLNILSSCSTPQIREFQLFDGGRTPSPCSKSPLRRAPPYEVLPFSEGKLIDELALRQTEAFAPLPRGARVKT